MSEWRYGGIDSGYWCLEVNSKMNEKSHGKAKAVGEEQEATESGQIIGMSHKPWHYSSESLRMSSKPPMKGQHRA